MIRTTRPYLGAVALALAAAASPAVAAVSPAGTVETAATLATADQRQLNSATIALLRDPAIKAASDTLLRRWRTLPQAALPQAAVNLRGAVDELVFFATELAVQQVLHPQAIAWILSPPYAPGIPGSRFGLDDPDRIYRVVSVDPARSYVIEGRRAASPSNDDFRFEAVADGLRTLGGLDARDIDVAADGTFRVTLDAAPAAGRRNHLTLVPGTNTVLIRDTLADWNTQQPNLLRFRQIGGALPVRGSSVEARQRAVALIEASDRFISGLLAGSLKIPENRFVASVRTLDQGLPGYIFASARYRLSPDEALVVTVDPQGAGYTGFEVTDPWLRSAPYWAGFGSLSGRQARPNADGSLTYIVAPRDPGYANWVSTDGITQGSIGIRVENMPLPSTVDAAKVVRDARVVRIDRLATALPADTPRVSPAERVRQLAERGAGFSKRVKR